MEHGAVGSPYLFVSEWAMRRIRTLAACALTLGTFSDCGAAQPAAQPPAAPASAVEPAAASSAPSWDPAETGKDCAKAQVQCGGGVCDAKIKNDCDAAVRCELAIAATCSVQGGASTANGGDHATIGAHETGEVGAQATCAGGQVVHTEVEKLSCK